MGLAQEMSKRTLARPMIGFSEEDVLRRILHETAAATGSGFFVTLVRSLSSAVNARVAWVTEYWEEGDALNALAFIADGRLLTDYRYPLEGTPCEPVIRGARPVYHADNVQEIYPDDALLKELGVRSYLGVPMLAADGQVLGHLAVMDPRAMPPEPMWSEVFSIFASRAAAEVQRARAEREQQELKRLLERTNAALRASEERFRDLFDEAPIAYVHEDLDSRILKANRTALKILGLRPEEVEGTYGKSLVPDTPEARERVDKALKSIRRGENTSGVVLELRRRDNGEPIWIQWWSSPAPDGSYTRTMFIDITAQVLTSRRNQLLEVQNSYLQEELRRTHTDEFVADSECMKQVIEDLMQVAPTDTTVLILGETGTGKELAARAIHAASSRSAKPLVKVNCAALPASLIESELFGHEKGSFTGATKARDGRFALADGGTIFLDEIGEIPIDLQVKLLRVLQEGEIERVGSSTTRTVDVRVIAATNRDLLKAIQNGEFREDLYYRLAVFPIEMPSLRDRGDDIVKLASEFSIRHAQRIGKRIGPLGDREARRLKAYSWPGNVRELQNVIERAVITSVDGSLNLDRALPESLPSDALASESVPPAVRTVHEMHVIERDNIILALQCSDWRVAGDKGAAKLLGINASTLSSRMKALGIRRPT
jgi:formate hydrogenlyase transcriptional activator